MICKIDVKNTPEYAEHRRYTVATLLDGILWFYGATDSAEWALQMQKEDPEHRVTLERLEK